MGRPWVILVFLLTVSWGLTSNLHAQVQPDSTEVRPDTSAMPVDSLFPLLPDSATKAAITDTTKSLPRLHQERKYRSSSAMEHDLDYHAEDSIKESMNQEKVWLYNEAWFEYGNIKLEAGYIQIDMKTNEVYATGIIDSAGNIVQKPIFTEGGQQFRTDTMRYNFDSGKAKIKRLITQEGDGFLHGEEVKRVNDSAMYISRASFTTCSHEHPHFRIMTTKTKVIPNDRIVAGPAYLEVLDIPTPLIVPFAFLPTMDTKKSGILIPSYGSSMDRGYFLRGGGFYLSLSDYWDYTVRSDVFTRGGYGLFNTVNYAQRYKFRGTVGIDYNRIVIGKPNFEPFAPYQNSSDFSIRWNHQQDPKANPELQFSANVNIATSSFYQLATTDPNTFLQNQLQSSVNITKSFVGKPYTLGVQLGHNQSNATGNLNLNLPTVNFNMSRVFPFKSRTFSGKEAWYEKIGISYAMNFDNRITTTLDDFELNPSFLLRESQNGVRHNVPINANYKVFKFFTLSPAVNYTQRWYFERLEHRYDEDLQEAVTDTAGGFYHLHDFTVRADLATKVYGMWNYKKGPVKAVRHVMTPRVGMSFAPDFSASAWGYYQDVQVDSTGRIETRSHYQGFIFGVPSMQQQGNINFQVDNTVEMKVRSKKDTTGEQKIKLLEGLGIRGSYNMAAEQFQWSLITVTARSSILKGLITLNFNTSYDLYAANEAGQRVNEFHWNTDGQLLRPVNSQFNIATNLSNKLFNFLSAKKDDKKTPGEAPPPQQGIGGRETGFGGMTEGDPNYFLLQQYVDYSSSWNLRLNYMLRSQNLPDGVIYTQVFDFSGDVMLTENWRIGFSSGYDIRSEGFTYTSLDFYRDLHCWELSCRWVPFGIQQSYFLTLGVKAPMFKDLKMERRRGIGDFGQQF